MKRLLFLVTLFVGIYSFSYDEKLQFIYEYCLTLNKADKLSFIEYCQSKEKYWLLKTIIEQTKKYDLTDEELKNFFNELETLQKQSCEICRKAKKRQFLIKNKLFIAIEALEKLYKEAIFEKYIYDSQMNLGIYWGHPIIEFFGASENFYQKMINLFNLTGQIRSSL